MAALEPPQQHFMKLYSDLVASTQEVIDSDIDFQNSIVDLSDEDKIAAISVKQEELINAEIETTNLKLSEAEKSYNNQKIRAEKAEAEAKKPKTETQTPKTEDKDLSGTDLYALMEAKVQKVDLPLVKTTAKALGLPIDEALNHPVLKTILKNAEEERRTAEAVNTGSSRKANTKVSGDLVKKAEKGELADEEMAEASKTVLAQMFSGK